MLRLLYWVIAWINFILQCLIYFVLWKALSYLRETSLILIFLINLLQHVSVHRCFNTGEWTLLSWQTKCSDFLIREKKKLKQFPYSSPSMLHSACFGSWKVAYYSEGHSLPFCGNITVRPAKELKKTMKADTDPRSLSWTKMFPSLCVCPSWGFFWSQRPMTCTISSEIKTINHTDTPRYTFEEVHPEINYILQTSKYSDFCVFFFLTGVLGITAHAEHPLLTNEWPVSFVLKNKYISILL